MIPVPQAAMPLVYIFCRKTDWVSSVRLCEMGELMTKWQKSTLPHSCVHYHLKLCLLPTPAGVPLMPEVSCGLTGISRAEFCWERSGHSLWSPKPRDYAETWHPNWTTAQEMPHAEGTGRACTLLVLTVVVRPPGLLKCTDVSP